MKLSGALRSQWPLWGMLLGLWSLLVLVFAGQLVLAGSVPWSRALVLSLRDWYPWAILAPVVGWLALRFPFERESLFVSVPVHLTGCVLCLLVCEWLAPPLPSPPIRRGPGPPMGPQRFEDRQLPFRPNEPFPENLPGSRFRQPNPANPPIGPRYQDGQADSAGPVPGDPANPRQPQRPGAFLDEPEPGQPQSPGGSPRFGPLPQARRALFMEALLVRGKFNLPVYWIIVSMVHAFTWYRRSQEKARNELVLEARLAEARLQALRMQLHPHFLFNTLNAISTLVHKDPNAADEMIVNLSELLRATLDTTDQEISLRKEIEFLDRYLEIQQVRFGSRLRIEKRIEANTLDALVPTMILQPLAENAIRHGLEPRTEPGRLQITAALESGRIHLRVEDDGPGVKQSAGPRQPEGIGLTNTRARLEALYGTSARLLISSSSQSGFAVDLELPFKTASAEATSNGAGYKG